MIRLLPAFGYLVFSYGNATEAVRKLQEKNNVRVVLADILTQDSLFIVRWQSVHTERPCSLWFAKYSGNC